MTPKTNTRRFVQFMAPVENLNGKLDRASKKVKNLPQGDYSGVEVYYAYRRNSDKTFFGLRARSRNLSTHPYTAEEIAHHSKFSSVMKQIKTIMSDPEQKQTYIEIWKEQGKEYKNIRTFLFAYLWAKA